MFSSEQRHTVAVYVQPPISSAQAPGIIILHGKHRV